MKGRSRRLRALVIGVPMIIAIGIVATALALRTDDAGGPTRDAAGIRELYEFDSLPELVATSDVAAIATVTRSDDGRVVGDADAALQFTQLTVQLAQVMRGDPASRTLLVETEAAEAAWAQRGTTSVFFLQRTGEGEFYRLVNSQGVFVVSPSGGLTPATSDEFTQRVAALSLADLRAEVRQAEQEIAAGKVAPQRPSLDRSRDSN